MPLRESSGGRGNRVRFVFNIETGAGELMVYPYFRPTTPEQFRHVEGQVLEVGRFLLRYPRVQELTRTAAERLIENVKKGGEKAPPPDVSPVVKMPDSLPGGLVWEQALDGELVVDHSTPVVKKPLPPSMRREAETLERDGHKVEIAWGGHGVVKDGEISSKPHSPMAKHVDDQKPPDLDSLLGLLSQLVAKAVATPRTPEEFAEGLIRSLGPEKACRYSLERLLYYYTKWPEFYVISDGGRCIASLWQSPAWAFQAMAVFSLARVTEISEIGTGALEILEAESGCSFDKSDISGFTITLEPVGKNWRIVVKW